MHEKKLKGDKGVAFTIARLTELEWNVGTLITEHAKYDLFAEKGGEMLRVQVRYTKAVKGRINIPVKNSWADKRGNHITGRQNGDFDVLAVYCPDTCKVYFIRETNFIQNKSSVTLLLELPKGRNASPSRLARDFEIL